ncbi:MAG: phosphatase [Clostridiales bacterium]|nr:phosphatase [Clostridiales bacterium]
MNDVTLIADLHCHTLASTHAYCTVTELARMARENGLLAVACTDHGTGGPDSPHLWHFSNLHVLPKQIEGIRVLQGAEANVIDFGGAIDLPAGILARLELVIASMHGGIMPEGHHMEACTAAWLKVAENPDIDIIGHSGIPEYTYDFETVIPAFGRGGKAVEINETTFRARSSSIPNCRRIAETCKKYGVRVAVDTDAHYGTQAGRAPQSLAMLREIDFPPKLIVNSSLERLAAFLSERGVAL